MKAFCCILGYHLFLAAKNLLSHVFGASLLISMYNFCYQYLLPPTGSDPAALDHLEPCTLFTSLMKSHGFTQYTSIHSDAANSNWDTLFVVKTRLLLKQGDGLEHFSIVRHLNNVVIAIIGALCSLVHVHTQLVPMTAHMEGKEV